MTQKIKAAAIGMDTRLGELEANHRRAEALITRAAEAGAELIALPETWNLGFYPQNVAQLAEEGGKSSNTLIRCLAQKYGVTIFSGSIAERRGDVIYNTTYVFNKQGDCISEYQKIHLYTHGKEHEYFTPGSKPAIFTTAGVKWGHIICYDLRFTELSRLLALQGAQVLLVPAQWLCARIDHWRTLLQARAIENQFYTIGINSTGMMVNDIPACGHSLVVNPRGEIMIEAGQTEEILVVELDLSLVDQVRREFALLPDRRPDVYRLE
jgi:omega-amidase